MKKALLILMFLVSITLIQTVSASEFVDVPDDAWYADDLIYTVDLDVVHGYSEELFMPDLPVTQAQFVTMLGRLFGGISEDGYTSYIAWAIDNDYVDERVFDDDAWLTTEQVAVLLDTFIEKSGIEPVDYEPIEVYIFYGQPADEEDFAVALGYGLLVVDDDGYIYPRKFVSRAECVVMLARLSKSLIPERTVFEYADLFPVEYEFISKHSIDDSDAIENNIRYVLQSNVRSLDFDFPFETEGITGYDYSDAYAVALRHYPEFASKYVSGYNVGRDGNGRIQFKHWPDYMDDIQPYQNDALETALEVRDRLYGTGQLAVSMSEYEKARVYYWYIVDTCDYDWYSFHGITDVPFAWMSYGPVILHKGTCQGYTALFNLFMRIEGVECSTVFTDDHIWSTAILDGTLYHVDTNWSDWKDLEPSEEWFGMTPEFALSRY